MFKIHPLKILRQSRRISARQLGELSGIGQKNIEAYENAWKVPGCHHAQAVANALGVPPAIIFPPEYTPAARREYNAQQGREA